MKSTYPKSLLSLIFMMCFFVGGNTLFAQEPVILEFESASKPDTEDDITPIVDVIVVPIIEHSTNPNILSIQDSDGKPNHNGDYQGANTQGTIYQEGAESIDEDFNTAEKVKVEVSLFPNPANYYTDLRLDADTDYAIAIYDLAGNNLKELNASDTSLFRIDLMDFKTGMYFVQIVCNNTQQTLRLKVVK